MTLERSPWCQRVLLVCLIAALLGGRAAGTQQQAIELRGTATDEGGGVLVGATATLTDARQQSRTTVTDAAGAYAFRDVAPGRYELLVELDGFAPVERQIDVSGEGPLTANVRMRVAIEQRVEVVASLEDFRRVTGLSPAGLTLRSRCSSRTI